MDLAAITTFRWWLLASLTARSPAVMAPLALVLAGEEATGSFASGALLAGVCGLAQGAGALWRGRLLDRPDRLHGLSFELVVSAAAFGALGIGLVSRMPMAVLLVLTAVGGLYASSLPGGYLARLPASVPPALLPRALTASAVSIELSWVIGPLAVTACALVLPAGFAVVLVAVSLLVSWASSGKVPPREWAADATSDGPGPRPWRNATVFRTYVIAASVATGFGLVDATLPALLERNGLDPAFGGILTSIPAAVSVVTGLVLLARRTDLDGRPPSTPAFLCVISGLALLPVALVSSFGGLAVFLGSAGILMSPMTAVWSHVLQRTLPSGRRAEGFTLLHAALRLGVGAGGALSALLLSHFEAEAVTAVGGMIPLAAGAVFLLVPHRRPASPSQALVLGTDDDRS